MNIQAQPQSISSSPLANARPRTAAARPTLLCLSHLRWGFVYQRPQHVMSRLRHSYDVVFFEEPVFGSVALHLDVSSPVRGVHVLVPHLPHGLSPQQITAAQRELLDGYLARQPLSELLLWYLTPMSLVFTDHLQAQVTVFDCMDELSAFLGAPPELIDNERRLMARADVVFTGGYSLWEAKRRQHGNAHAMPSSVDIEHFAAAREGLPEPADQASIGHPRLGFFGVIDERFDIELVAELARQQPQWQVVLIGPVVKIDPASLPRYANIHYLGAKSYAQLPAYLSGWEVALMPFALNASTRYISPTKTPEYLAGGCPVVSTPIRDVVSRYGDCAVVTIAEDAPAFIEAVECALAAKADGHVAAHADAALKGMSWDATCNAMKEQVECFRSR
ncbi:Glycosyl transferase [Pseudomonas reidholzensis]|uniref:Glycosyl transferase n=1 Tax=Pseudomonas reidholzensis TaxID=1785162 RepID=A0A383RQA5_9PSED|nr:glycosyltransferase family 1 protein [Pseudomonas reidholzensis]SYX89075.1 Glycosyl transferase [Pseudomonas reidholzensis]